MKMTAMVMNSQWSLLVLNEAVLVYWLGACLSLLEGAHPTLQRSCPICLLVWIAAREI